MFQEAGNVDKFVSARRQVKLLGVLFLCTLSTAIIISIVISAIPKSAAIICQSKFSSTMWPSNDAVKGMMLEAGNDFESVCRLMAARSVISLMLLICAIGYVAYATVRRNFYFSPEYAWVYFVLIILLPVLLWDYPKANYSRYNMSTHGSIFSNIYHSYMAMAIAYFSVSGAAGRLIYLVRSKCIGGRCIS